MKKYFSNIRIMAALLLAGAAFTACSSDNDSIIDDLQQQPVNPTEKTYTLTLKASNGTDTRALSLENNKIVASWEVDDELVVTKGTTPLGTLSCKSVDGSTATFSGKIMGEVAENDVLTLTYHPVSGYSDYGNQDGTLNGTDYSAENYDMATATITIASVDESNTISLSDESIYFTTQTALLKIKLTDGTNPLNAVALKVTATINNFITAEVFNFQNIPASTYTTNGAGVLYFAIPNVNLVAERMAEKYAMYGLTPQTAQEALASAEITFTASAGASTYTATKSGYAFLAGHRYTTTLTMEKQ